MATAKDNKKDPKAEAGKAADAPKRGRAKSEGPTIASVAYAAIQAGKDNKEVLADVQKQFPDAKTGMASINWYRNKAREEDPKIPTSRDITKKRTAEKKKAEKAAKEAEKKAGKGKPAADDPTA